MGPKYNAQYLYKRKEREIWMQRPRGDTQGGSHVKMKAKIEVVHL